MYTSMSEAADEQRQAAIENGPNLDVAADLRDVADWLEQHPELPKVRWGTVVLRYPGFSYATDARGILSTVAGALGARASETTMAAQHVEIAGRFGVVTVKAVARTDELGAKPVVEYEPILAPAPDVDLPISTDELIAEAER